MRERIVKRGMAAGALLGAIVGTAVGWMSKDFGFWIPTAIAIGVGVGLAIEVGRGPNT